ncbi:MAG: B12-binding domain-containing radical SAM protein [Chloroflexi bacterium]|nr:B12-binding domain-containing radical SAM protein [Chloroflexota bacterium]
MKKRLVLIQPKPEDKRLITESTGRLYPLGLLIIDALTPKEEWDVQIIDEGKERLNIDALSVETLSLAGINSWTNQAARAYQIASALRQRGVPVILGGPHPSVLSSEALQYADSVCVGEAEGVWSTILDDVTKGTLKPLYHGGNPSLDNVPILRSSFRDKYGLGSIQTARGCPYDCAFCSVTSLNGGTIRYRPIPDVVEEFRNIKQKAVFVVDDNFIGSGRAGRERALELCKALAVLRKQGVRKYWGTQATQNLGQDNEVLEWMYKAGCRLVLFGLESTNSQVIKDMHKGINTLGNYKAHIQNTQRHGIAVIASFIFGSDEDPPTVFEDTVRFIKEARVATQNLNIACPLPGTRLFEEVARAGRLRYTNFPIDWEKYNLNQLVFDPKNFSPLELYRRRKWAEGQLSGKITLFRRTLRTLWDTRSLSAAVIALGWNLQSGSRAKDYQYQIELLEKEMVAELMATDTTPLPIKGFSE